MFYLKKELSLPPSCTDAHAELKIASLANMIQDIAGEHAENMGVGFHDMNAKSNAFWIITRTKIHVLRPAKLYEKVVLETWPSKPSGLVCIRNYRMTSSDGELLATAKNEWAIIDALTHKLRRLSSTCYPVNGTYSNETAIDEPFTRAYEPCMNDDYVYSHHIRYSDTDHVRHTNNVSYIRILLDALPSDFFEKNIITDFEIKHVHESKEGDNLAIYAKPTADGYTLYGKTPLGEEIASARLSATARK